MRNPFIDAMFGFRGGCGCYSTPYFGGYPGSYFSGRYPGDYSGVFGFRRDPFIPNPYALHDYYGNMAYSSYGITGLDPRAYRMGECYEFDYNMMNMHLYPRNTRMYDLGGKMYSVFNPNAGSYDYIQPYDDVNKIYQRQKFVIEAGTRAQVNLFNKNVTELTKMLNDFETYAKTIKDCGNEERAAEVQKMVDNMKEELKSLEGKMEAAANGKDWASSEVLYATDAVLKELMRKFGQDCGEFKADIDELMAEVRKFEKDKATENTTKTGTKDDEETGKTQTTTTKTENGKSIEQYKSLEVTISKAKKEGEEYTNESTQTQGNNTVKTIKFINNNGEELRSVVITEDKNNNVLKEEEIDFVNKTQKTINYDNNGKKTSSVEKTENSIIEITYQNGNVARYTKKDNENNEIFKVEVLSNGYKKTIKNTDNTETVIEFNKEGLPTKETTGNSVKEHTYSDGKKSETNIYSGSTLISKVVYEYVNGESLPSKATEMDTDGHEIATYKYEYDSDGRLITETKTQGGQDTVKTYDYD